jgi:hypothetical protein
MSDEETGDGNEQAFRDDVLELISQYQKEDWLELPEMAKTVADLIIAQFNKDDAHWKNQCLEALKKVTYDDTEEYEKAKVEFEKKFEQLLAKALYDDKLSRLDIVRTIIEKLGDENFDIDPVY